MAPCQRGHAAQMASCQRYSPANLEVQPHVKPKSSSLQYFWTMCNAWCKQPFQTVFLPWLDQAHPMLHFRIAQVGHALLILTLYYEKHECKCCKPDTFGCEAHCTSIFLCCSHMVLELLPGRVWCQLSAHRSNELSGSSMSCTSTRCSSMSCLAELTQLHACVDGPFGGWWMDG